MTDDSTVLEARQGASGVFLVSEPGEAATAPEPPENGVQPRPQGRPPGSRDTKPRQRAVPAKKGGRPPGYPKTGGKPSPPRGAAGKEGREWLAENSKCLDLLARVCAGKAVKLAGPTGKQLWHYPSWADQKWAAEKLLPRLVPALQSTEVSGPDGSPAPGLNIQLISYLDPNGGEKS